MTSQEGVLVSGTCFETRRFLATSGVTPVAFVWPGEEVEVHCRPSRPGGCRWFSGSTELGGDCVLRTAAVGLLHCRQDDETVASLQLRRPDDTAVIIAGRATRGHDLWNPFLRVFTSMPSYATFSDIQSARQKTHLCSRTGVIVSGMHICDGIDNCRDGEDERGCDLPCGAPALGEHSYLQEPAQRTYPSRANVTYHCQSGFSFSETLSGLNRTCWRGRWTGVAPTCRQNVAFNQTVVEEGPVMSSRSSQAAVDGEVDTWSIFVPSSQPQSLSVTTPGGVVRVLVRSPSAQYHLSLRVHNNGTGPPVRCTCGPNHAPHAFPKLSGEAVCTCPVQPGPTDVVISSEPSTFMGLAVAELAALADLRPDEPSNCAMLDQPAHGSFALSGNDSVRLSCEPGFRPSCSQPMRCADISVGRSSAVCLPLTCWSPPALPHTTIVSQNGTGWSSVAEYGCAAGFTLFPVEQRTESVCTDGLWSLSHLSCLPDSDVRVVTLQLRQQHARHVAALRAELEGSFQAEIELLKRQADQAQQRLRKLEAGLQGLRQKAEQELLQERAELELVQERAAKQERLRAAPAGSKYAELRTPGAV
ncbi:hypothetical protein FJT64_020713 [Amphibalanus amphitrite]|uniref:Sushi domain-containing protein n=1 Tax=Amphibalanus amphitrite TaxID=1232801 RepID=A0A6A4WWM3_AMPAM|nr:hypothetical protein FJT64_020713 [Amphibalanus amphitrite]